MTEYQKRLELILTIGDSVLVEMKGNYPSFIDGTMSGQDPLESVAVKKGLVSGGHLLDTTSLKVIPGKYRYTYDTDYHGQQMSTKIKTRRARYAGTEATFVTARASSEDRSYMEVQDGASGVALHWFAIDDAIAIFQRAADVHEGKRIGSKPFRTRATVLEEYRSFIL